jgi:putative transposase
MPNHIHLVVNVERSDASLYRILQSLKAFTALKANRILGHSGAFWQHESYDHVVRDDIELERIVWYVLQNPVKARLCRQWQDWRWSYVKEGLIDE